MKVDKQGRIAEPVHATCLFEEAGFAPAVAVREEDATLGSLVWDEPAFQFGPCRSAESNRLEPESDLTGVQRIDRLRQADAHHADTNLFEKRKSLWVRGSRAGG